MPAPHPLEEIFHRTSYRVRLPQGGYAPIRIGECLPSGVFRLLPEPDTAWGFITACNPRGQTRSREHNRRAMRLLCDALRQEAPDARLHAGCGALGGWREPSLFAVDICFELLDALMQRFNQLAIVRGRGRGAAVLHWSKWLAHAEPDA